MTILFFGDVMGRIGRRALQALLPDLRRELAADYVIANAENLAHGKGVSRATIEELRSAGVDAFTSGNHIWKKPEVFELIEDADLVLLRPENYPPGNPGTGVKLVQIGVYQLFLVNLMGRVFMKETVDCPFRAFDAFWKMKERDYPAVPVLVDFHADATSEKQAMLWHVAGRASAIVGSHTHVPTADARILEGGTAAVTDAGMCGARDGVIGMERAPIIQQFLLQRSTGADIPEIGPAVIQGVAITIDPETAKATNIVSIRRETIIQ